MCIHCLFYIGSECLSVQSSDICNKGNSKIYLYKLKLSKPNSEEEQINITTYIQYEQPTKICFLPPAEACSLEYGGTNDKTVDSPVITLPASAVIESDNIVTCNYPLHIICSSIIMDS